MNQDLPSTPDPETDATLVHLVDGFIDDRLDEDEKRQLEERLLSDEKAMEYCADRIGFHADMQTLLQPIRVEVIQKRHFVFEQRHGLPRFAVRESQVTQIGTPGSDKFIEIPPDIVNVESCKKRAIAIGSLACLAVALTVSILLWNSNKDESSAVPETASDLTLRNPSFESTDLTHDDDAYSYILLDWQDLFMSRRAGICEIERYSDGKLQAPTGKNVAILKPKSYLTQRLRLSDDKPLLVSPGLHLRVKGKISVQNTNNPVPLRLALRVVQSIIPEMVQYEPQFVSIPAKGETWQEFQADFILPTDPADLVLKPSDVMVESKADQEINVEGEPLTLSIDNRTEATFYLDDLSIEIIPASSGE